MSLSVSRNRSLNIFGARRARPVDDFLVARFFAFLAINPPVEVNGKAPPSSILGRSRRGEAKGSHCDGPSPLLRPLRLRALAARGPRTGHGLLHRLAFPLAAPGREVACL